MPSAVQLTHLCSLGLHSRLELLIVLLHEVGVLLGRTLAHFGLDDVVLALFGEAHDLLLDLGGWRLLFVRAIDSAERILLLLNVVLAIVLLGTRLTLLVFSGGVRPLRRRLSTRASRGLGRHAPIVNALLNKVACLCPDGAEFIPVFQPELSKRILRRETRSMFKRYC